MYRVLPLLVVLTLVPGAVQAQGFVRWLGKLSGPGPFWGLGAEVRVKCFGVDRKSSRNEGDTIFHSDETQTAQPASLEAQRKVAGARLPCPNATFTPDLDRHATVYFNVSGAIAENNPLDYQDDGPQDESTAVRMLKVGTSIDWTVHRTVDVGTGFGLIYFGGPRFDNFSRGYVQPVRVTLRPLLFSAKAPDTRGWLLVSANGQILLGTIDGADFGAPADPFRSHNEQDVELGVSVDVLRLVRMIGRPDKD
jgi:hypothetical protein